MQVGDLGFMNKRLILLYFPFLFFLTPVFSQGNVSIKGNAPYYKSEVLIFSQVSDFITGMQLPVASATIGANGDFSCSFYIDETCLIKVELGIFRGLLFAEPGRTYRISLPPKTDKTAEDKINPYFKPAEIYLEIQNPGNDELNEEIRQFDNLYDSLMNFEILQNAYKRNSKRKTDSLIMTFDSRFDKFQNPYFNEYRKYKYGFIRLLSSLGDEKNIISNYFSGKQVSYSNPAYMELFNQVFNKVYVPYTAFTGKFQDLWENMKAAAVGSVIEKERGRIVLSGDSLIELIALKALYNSYYNNTIPAKDFIGILDSLIISTNTLFPTKKIAVNIREKACSLALGSDAPFFELLDRDNQHVKLTNLKGKYVYLNFCTFWSLPCKEEFGLLNKLQHDHGDKIEVVTIIGDGDYRNFIEDLSKNDYNWTFLHYGNDTDILNRYHVIVFPSYYLIDPYGRVVMSPAPSPRENFEARFAEILRLRN